MSNIPVCEYVSNWCICMIYIQFDNVFHPLYKLCILLCMQSINLIMRALMKQAVYYANLFPNWYVCYTVGSSCYYNNYETIATESENR